MRAYFSGWSGLAAESVVEDNDKMAVKDSIKEVKEAAEVEEVKAAETKAAEAVWRAREEKYPLKVEAVCLP